MTPCEIKFEAVRLYQSFVLDIMRERAGGLFIDDEEVITLVHEIAEFLGVDDITAGMLLYKPYRHAMDLLNSVQP
jgi:hypothetical protein